MLPVMTWRQIEGSETWHFVPKCSNWPTAADSTTRKTKPASGQLCHECVAKQAAVIAACVLKAAKKVPQIPEERVVELVALAACEPERMPELPPEEAVVIAAHVLCMPEELPKRSWWERHMSWFFVAPHERE